MSIDKDQIIMAGALLGLIASVITIKNNLDLQKSSVGIRRL